MMGPLIDAELEKIDRYDFHQFSFLQSGLVTSLNVALLLVSPSLPHSLNAALP